MLAHVLVGEPDPTSPGHALGMGIGLLLRSQRRVDLASNTPSGQCGQPRLGSAGLGAVVEFIPPLPDVWFGGRNDRVLNTPVNHQQGPPSPKPKGFYVFNQSGQLRIEINSTRIREMTPRPAQKQRVSRPSGQSFSALEKENNNRALRRSFSGAR